MTGEAGMSTNQEFVTVDPANLTETSYLEDKPQFLDLVN